MSHSKCEFYGFDSHLAESGVNELVELPDSESGFNGGSSPTASIFMDKCTSGLCGFPAKEVIGNFPWVQIPPYPSLLCYGRNGRGNWF